MMRRSKRKTTSQYANKQKKGREAAATPDQPMSAATEPPPQPPRPTPQTTEPSESSPGRMHIVTHASSTATHDTQYHQSTPQLSVNTTESQSLGLHQNVQIEADQNIEQIPSIHASLGFNVSQVNKTKIINGQYVDLANLLDNTHEQNNEKQIIMIDGVLSTKEKSKQAINTVEKWTDAFIVFTSIYTAAHPQKFQALLKYMNVVRLGASRVRGLGWKSYDEQFRLKMNTDPTKPWDIIDQELWLLFMGNSKNSSPEVSSQTSYKTSVNKCYNYNYTGTCDRNPCNYKHICFKCSGNHPYYLCPGNNSNMGTYSARSNYNFRPQNTRTQYRSPSSFQGYPRQQGTWNQRFAGQVGRPRYMGPR